MTSREAAKRAVRLHTAVIPATRLGGLAVVTALLPLHNAAVLGSPQWSSMGAFALAASLYSAGSWLILKRYFLRWQKVPLGDIFLVADILLLLFAVDLSGGSKSWLFLLLAGRCVDQLSGGYRRTLWFNHCIVGLYAFYLLLDAVRHGQSPTTVYAAKLAFLYVFNWYCSFSAKTVDAVRARARKAELTRRTEAEIAGTVAHSIRTSAEGIAILTDLLSQTSLTPRQTHFVKGLAEYSQDVSHKTSVLDASAAEKSRTAVRESPISPRSLTEEVASLLRPLAESKGLDFRLDVERHLPLSMMGDGAKIRQVLLSLAHNAIRFTETGFVELSCWRLWPGHIVFEVEDSGPGIPAGVQRRVCEGFVRADGTTWHRYHGTQIGLSISKRLVELMGGRLILQSDPWRGTSIRVELPIQGTSSFFVPNHQPAVTRPLQHAIPAAPAGSTPQISN